MMRQEIEAVAEPPSLAQSQSSLLAGAKPPLNPTLADVLPFVYDGTRSFDLIFKGSKDLQHLRLTSKQIKAALDSKITKINISAGDLDTLAVSLLPSFITNVNFRANEGCTDIYGAVKRFCEIPIPNLFSLKIQNIDVVSLPLLGESSWPKLKILNIKVLESGFLSTSTSFLRSWMTAGWPLTSLSVNFTENMNGCFPAVAYILPAFPSLKLLNIDHVDASVASTIVQANLTNLEILYIECPRFPSIQDWPGVPEAISAGKWPKLRIFGLYNDHNMQSNDCFRLSEASWLHNLEELSIYGSMIRCEAKVVFEGLQGLRLKSLTLRMTPFALLESEKLSANALPDLVTLNLHLTDTDLVDSLDLPLEALFKTNLPKLAKLLVNCEPSTSKLVWRVPPTLDGDWAEILPSLKGLEMIVPGMSGACLQYLGQHFVAKKLSFFRLRSPQFEDCTDPLADLLQGVANANLAAGESPPLRELRMPFAADNPETLFLQQLSKLPNLIHVELTDIALKSSWYAVVNGIKFTKLPMTPPKYRMMFYKLHVSAANALGFSKKCEDQKVVEVRFPHEAESAFERLAEVLLRREFGQQVRVDGPDFFEMLEDVEKKLNNLK